MIASYDTDGMKIAGDVSADFSKYSGQGKQQTGPTYVFIYRSWLHQSQA
jgi:hypothetical protein